MARDRRPACQASSDITADRLGQYFIDKVDAVRAETKDAPPPTYTRHDGQQLCSFRVLSVDDVRRVVMRGESITSQELHSRSATDVHPSRRDR